MYRVIVGATAFATLLALSGCTALFQPGLGAGMRTGASSSLVDYLYPHGESPPAPSESIPQLELPLRVGLAFVPTGGRQSLSEATRTELLGSVRQAFIEYDYIEHIEVIPDTYLRSGNGIAGMQQVARLYGVDVMALVSYDQVSVSSDTRSSFLYWTIVGAYLVEGTKNDVQTFVDTAVFDVRTAKLMFRAPGTSKISDRSTAIESTEAARQQGETSFAAAVGDMTGNLAAELARFEERVAGNPQLASVTYKQGYGGGGAPDGWLLLLLVLFAIGGIAVTSDGSPRRKKGSDPVLPGKHGV